MSYKDLSQRSSSLDIRDETSSIGKTNVLLSRDKFVFKSEANSAYKEEQGGDSHKNPLMLDSS